MKFHLLLTVLSAFLCTVAMPFTFAASNATSDPATSVTTVQSAIGQVTSKPITKDKRQGKLKNWFGKKLGKNSKFFNIVQRVSLGFVGFLVTLLGAMFIVLGITVPYVGVLFLVIGIIIAFVGLVLWVVLSKIGIRVSSNDKRQN